MSWVIWFTGLPGCGKTTIAQLVGTLLEEKGIVVKYLQLDEIRRVVTPNPTYSEEERDIVYASLAYMAKLLAEAGNNVIIDATANNRRYRDLARDQIPHFAEVYVKASIPVCIERESARDAVYSPKKIYKRAGEEGATVPGINVAYEESLDPEIVLDSEKFDPQHNAQVVVDMILDAFVGSGA